MPALANAVHNESDITLVILDNSGTAMTGFQTHPGRPADISGKPVPALSLEMICRAMGATVRVCDPFNIAATQETLLDLMENEPGAKVLILRQICALSPERKGKKPFEMSIDKDICRGVDCGCNRLCTRIFSCPGLVVDDEKGHAHIDEVQCVGCGVCASICPSGAITKKEVA
jgi:indolepyruvate ferredoxin oxidoreductase alpha subunit